MIKLALVGNQNCGKTTLFNQLTGSNQRVGNFPGVTVDSKIGQLKNKKNCEVIDLPGIYSLRPYTDEEIVTRDCVINEKLNGIINIVDATAIERNLYLTTQLLTLNIPIVIALNMMDEVRSGGGTINVQKMSEMLGCPVIPISASKNEGVDELIETVCKVAENGIKPAVIDICKKDSPVHRCIHSTMHLIEDHTEKLGISSRFCAMNLIVTNTDFAKRLSLDKNENDLLEHIIVEMENDMGLDRDAAIAEMTYNFIENITAASVIKCKESKERIRSEKIDKVLTSKWLSIPLFILIMFSIYLLTFQVLGKVVGDGISWCIDKIDYFAIKGLTIYGVNPAVIDFLDKGLFGGLGAVVSLLPYILFMFLFLSLLEDSGYMARIAFIMDKPLRKIGLSGRSFVPIIVGFGCSVPAIMSTRTLASERDRRITIGLIPFISCSAKAIVYYAVVNCGLFYWWQQSIIILCLYILGIFLGILTALITGKFFIKGKAVPFVMELPNYRLPSLKSVLMLMWEKAKDFLSRAFTVIFLATLIIWFLQAYNTRLIFINNDTVDKISLLERIGNILAPAFKPVGLNDGKIVSALVAGFTAKEAVISTIQMLAGGAEISSLFVSRLNMFSFLTFVLLYTPCVATVSTMKKEYGFKKTAILIIYQCVLAWVSAFVVYNIGRLFL